MRKIKTTKHICVTLDKHIYNALTKNGQKISKTINKIIESWLIENNYIKKDYFIKGENNGK